MARSRELSHLCPFDLEYPIFELSNRAVDVVFLHGLLGGVFYTWRQHDKMKERSWSNDNLVSEDKYSYCWPKDWLEQDGLGDRVRVIGVDCKLSCTLYNIKI